MPGGYQPEARSSRSAQDDVPIRISPIRAVTPQPPGLNNVDVRGCRSPVSKTARRRTGVGAYLGGVAQGRMTAERARLRAESVPAIRYPEELPIVQRREQIAEAIRDNQVVIIAGETGSGKTTQIPK